MKHMRQIVTKAVVAKGKKRTESREILCPPNTPSSILGCWVINHSCQSKKHGRYVEVTGKFDINVWYAHHDHSKTSVFTETIQYKDRIKLHYRDRDSTGEEVHLRVLQQPNCTEAIIIEKGTKFQVTVERELLAEVVGETTIYIQVQEDEVEEEWVFGEESSSVAAVPANLPNDSEDSSSL
ncbi:outer spore coat protein CotE [Psychrobacillus sp. NEAU-3TGS]|uniref:outer spore coat protein CotE n=1 Tax=Psychrobacillus sp. NEAU-3TGS TaxID=2995412 RepID=UPI002497476A|nr:outer spore coat protein CotE [Psychrobacillus sp. NEAU-3TGS]MDI2588480.1 outer spore coat protein CotE [Psychrobacillus sp. NEAU-3TGS]